MVPLVRQAIEVCDVARPGFGMARASRLAPTLVLSRSCDGTEDWVSISPGIRRGRRRSRPPGGCGDSSGVSRSGRLGRA